MKKILIPILFLSAFANNNISAQNNINYPIRKIDIPNNSSQSLTGFPYHPLAYFLDLSILSYQLYAQTLVWPFDPYYERVKKRNAFMRGVRNWVREKGKEQCITPSSANDFRGPGELSSFENNSLHDPIIYRYNSINPGNDCIVNADGRWIIYETPKKITNIISEVYMCYRKKKREY